MMIDKPIIGIIPDYKEESEQEKSSYIIRSNYINMIQDAGGVVEIMTYNHDIIDYYLNRIDGLLIIGGGFDINPIKYNEKEVHKTVNINNFRGDFEYNVLSRALKINNVPVFGICNGMQLINVVLKGSLLQHIEATKNGFMDHEQNNNSNFSTYSQPYHKVKIYKNTKLFNIIGKESIETNSSHHQAIKNIGNDIIISAEASDGIIEAIEYSKHPFCLGVQWHPEFYVNESDKKLFNHFVLASKDYKYEKRRKSR